MRARVWLPEVGVFSAIDELAYHDARSTLWGWPGLSPVRWADPSGRHQPPGGKLEVGLFSSQQIADIFLASGTAALDASRGYDVTVRRWTGVRPT